MAVHRTSPPPRRSFRLVCDTSQVPLVEDFLTAQGFVFEPEPFSPLARRLVHEPFPLGRSLAALFGYLYIQDRSSMLPPLALAPEPGSRILDFCASPGSKTGLLAQLTGPRGLVLGNEPGKPRLATLRENLAHLQLWQTATCSWPGEELEPGRGSGLGADWSWLLLDPPCSGWGTTDRHPQVMQLWQGNKVQPLIHIQRCLLRTASRLLCPGGRLVYSTCTTNVDENEAQVRYAVDELGLELVPLAPFAGFSFADPLLPGCEGTLRVDEAASEAQGFFIALLRRPLAGTAGDWAADSATGFANGPTRGPTPDLAFSAPGTAPDAPSSLSGSENNRPEKGRARVWSEKSRSPRARPGNDGEALRAAPRLDPEVLREVGLDPDALPAGEVVILGDHARLIPALARDLPPALRWQGPSLGKISGGRLVPWPRIRALLSGPHMARLDLDDVDALTGLLEGRSLETSLTGRDAALFWRGLALGRARLRNGRVVWSDR